MRVRRLAATLLLAACAAPQPPTPPAGPAPEPAEWDRPFLGMLPMPDEASSVNPPERGVPLPQRRAAYILDERTGAPIPGASLWCTRETEDEHVISYGERLGESVADADGLAVVDPGTWDGDINWIAEAPGYAPLRVIGYRPDARMLLRRGGDVVLRVLDGLGRPVAGADVDHFLGCLHAPPVRTPRTASDGTCTLQSVGTEAAWSDIRTATLGRDQFSARSLGRRPMDVVLEPRWHLRGRLLDADGRPVSGAAVRSNDWPRGPRARTDADGRFELPGYPPDEELFVTLPGTDEPIAAGNAFGPAPITLRLDAARTSIDAPETDAGVTLHVRTPDGAPVAGQWVRMTRVEDGWAADDRTADADDDPPGSLELELPAGVYDVEPSTAFGPVTFTRQRFDVAEGGQSEWSITATRQPTLGVRGSIAQHGEVVLAADGDEIRKPDEVALADWMPHLPATSEAAVRVRPSTQAPVVFFFRVGAAVNGVRTVEVRVPEPHAIELRGAGEGAWCELACDGLEIASEGDDATLTTYAQGRIHAAVQNHDADESWREFDFDLGPVPGPTVVLDFAKGRPVPPRGEVVVRCVPPPGVAPSDVRVVVGTEGVTSRSRYDGPQVDEPPCRVVLALRGHQSFDRWFPAAADVEHRWGACALKLAVRDRAGAPAPSIVGVDGVRHWTRAGDVELAGLLPGPYYVIVCPADDRLGGRSLRIVLRDGETRERSVVVPATEP